MWQGYEVSARVGSVSSASALETEQKLLVSLGEAPDGLPWVLRVDRQHQIVALLASILSSYGVPATSDLPPTLRRIVEGELSRGLFAIHDGETCDGRQSRFYVSRLPMKQLLAPSLLARLLGAASGQGAGPPTISPAAANTIIIAPTQTGLGSAEVRYEQVERHMREMRTARHLAIDTARGGAWIASVGSEDRALRRPSQPLGRLLYEQLASFPGAVAIFPDRGRIPLSDRPALADVLADAATTGHWPGVRYEVPTAAVVAFLVETARAAGRLHATGRLHGDLTPGNVLACADGPALIDSSRPEIGSIVGLATFAWAAPEQVLGRPADARADVFALGRMLTVLAGGVPYGEETSHVIPVGGRRAEHVKVLRCEGVFIDRLDTGRDRAAQVAWSDLLSRAMHRDVERRQADGTALADEVARVAAEHRLDGTLTISDDFGRIERVEIGGRRALARILDDGPQLLAD